jgi:copper transport protein
MRVCHALAMRAAALAAAALAVALLLAPGEAAAHAVLMSASPRDGAVLAAPPAELRLEFAETVRPVAVDIVDAAGTRTPLLGVARVDGGAVAAPLPPLADGAYLASWRVVSEDGHPVGGSLVFTVGAGGAAGADALRAGAPPGDDPVLARVDAALRAALLVAAALAVGGVLARLTVGPPAPDRRGIVRAAALAGAAAALLGAGVRGALLAGAEPDAIATAQPWLLAAGTGHGHAAAVAVLGFLLIAGGGRTAPALGSAAVLASFALSGHPAAAEPRWLAAGAIVLHVGAAAAWVGALPALLHRLDGRPREAAAAVRRFGRTGPPIVAALALAGVVSASLQLDAPADLAASGYGLLLLAKAAGLGALLGFAALNRLRLTPLLRTAPDRAARGLRLSIRLELAAGVGVLALAAALAQTPPPRAEAARHRHHHGDHHGHAAAPAGWAAALSGPGVVAVVELSPAAPGPNRLLVVATRPDGAPLRPVAAYAEVGLPSLGVEPARREMARDADGNLVLDGLVLPVAGDWSLRLEILVTDFDLVPLAARMPVRAPAP